MRKQMKRTVMKYVCEEMKKTRAYLSMTQAEMAAQLGISTRGYRNLEAGRSCCGLLTLLLFWKRCCLDRETFLYGLWEAIETAEYSEFIE